MRTITITTILLLCFATAQAQCLGYAKRGQTPEGNTIWAVGKLVTMTEPGFGITITPVVDNTGLTYFGLSWSIPGTSVLAKPRLTLLLAQGHHIQLVSLTKYKSESHIFAFSESDKVMLAEYPIIQVSLHDDLTDTHYLSPPLHPDFFICALKAAAQRK